MIKKSGFRPMWLAYAMATVLSAMFTIQHSAVAQFGGGNGNQNSENQQWGVLVRGHCESNYSVVRLKSVVPDMYYEETCTVLGAGTLTADQTVVLTNPDGKLLFLPKDQDSASNPSAVQSTLSLCVTAQNKQENFKVVGATGSTSIGDAVIEVHQDTADGSLLASKTVTVFHFDSPVMDLSEGDYYWFHSSGNPVWYEPGNGQGESLTAAATLKPDGLDTSGPQLSGLRVGIMQNIMQGSHAGGDVFHNPVATWTASHSAVTVPAVITLGYSLPATFNDFVPSDLESMVMMENSDLGEPNNLQKPWGYSGGANCTTMDAGPKFGAFTHFDVKINQGGTQVGTIVYDLDLGATGWPGLQIYQEVDLKAWCVIFQRTIPNTITIEALAERDWQSHVHSNLTFQKCSSDSSPSVPPSSVPTVSTKSANAAMTSPANQTMSTSGSITFN